MYPTISDLLREIFGLNIPLPIQTFGFFVAIAFLIAAWVFSLELKRKEGEGLLKSIIKKHLVGKKASATDLITSGILGFLLGYKGLHVILNYTEFVANPQAMILSGEGNLIGGLIGAGLGAWLKYREKEKEKLATPLWKEETIRPHEQVGTMTMIAAIAGLLGAKIFHNLENLEEFAKDPIDALLSFSGLTMYGGLICGAAAVLIYAKKNNLGILPVMDASAPALMLGYGIGRIGCHVAGDGDWGIVNAGFYPDFLPDWFWGYTYPHNVINEGVPIPGCEGRHCMMLPEAVFPTAMYEAIACILLFLFLWSIRKRMLVPGLMFSVYLFLNGLERFSIEKIRVNTTYQIFGNHITQAEIISSVFILLGISGIIYFGKKQKTFRLERS